MRRMVPENPRCKLALLTKARGACPATFVTKVGLEERDRAAELGLCAYRLGIKGAWVPVWFCLL